MTSLATILQIEVPSEELYIYNTNCIQKIFPLLKIKDIAFVRSYLKIKISNNMYFFLP